MWRAVQNVDVGSIPHGIAVDPHGRIYVAVDEGIKLFDLSGRLARQWPAAQPALAVAIAPDGSVFAGESGQIEIFNPAGKLLRTWRDRNLLRRVTSIGFTRDTVLAGDAAGRAIRAFDRAGKFLRDIGTDNNVRGLMIPNGVVDFAVDAQGIIWAANPGKHRVERYTAEGNLLGHIGRFHGIDPAGFGGCCNPTNVAVGTALYVTEKAGPRVKAYDFSGNLLGVIAADVFDFNSKNMDIAVARWGGSLDPRATPRLRNTGSPRLFVADTVKNSIFIFEAVAA